MLATIAGLCLVLAAALGYQHRRARHELERVRELRRRIGLATAIREREDGRGWQ